MHGILRGRNPEAFGGVSGAQIRLLFLWEANVGHVWLEDTSWISEEVSKKVRKSRWWFQRFFMFTPIWGRCPI